MLNPRDTLYSRAQAWAALIAESLLVTEYVVWEMVNSLSLPVDRPKAHLAVQEIQTASDWEWVPASNPLFIAGMQLHRERGGKSWSLTDCISFQVMQQRNIRRALTYDHHFEQAGYEALIKDSTMQIRQLHIPVTVADYLAGERAPGSVIRHGYPLKAGRFAC